MQPSATSPVAVCLLHPEPFSLLTNTGLGLGVGFRVEDLGFRGSGLRLLQIAAIPALEDLALHCNHLPKSHSTAGGHLHLCMYIYMSSRAGILYKIKMDGRISSPCDKKTRGEERPTQ